MSALISDSATRVFFGVYSPIRPVFLFMKAFALPYILTSEDDLNYTFGLIDETFPASWNPYVSPMGEAMPKLMATIQRERPDVFQKLQRGNLPSEQLFSEISKISRPIS